MAHQKTNEITLFWSFRSPYSYLVMPRLRALAHQNNLSIDVKVVHPNILRNPNYFKTMNPLARPYFMRDTARTAEFLGMSFRRPVPDPITQDPVTLEVGQDQPMARWLGRLGVAASEAGQGFEFCWQVSQLLWDGSTDGWDQGNHLADACQRAGLDWTTLNMAVKNQPEHYESMLQSNADALTAAGHWGVPTMVYEDEVFFGQDRLDVLAWRIQQSKR